MATLCKNTQKCALFGIVIGNPCCRRRENEGLWGAWREFLPRRHRVSKVALCKVKLL